MQHCYGTPGHDSVKKCLEQNATACWGLTVGERPDLRRLDLVCHTLTPSTPAFLRHLELILRARCESVKISGLFGSKNWRSSLCRDCCMTVEAGEHAVADVGIRYRGPSSTLSACFDTACITSLLPPRPRNLMSASNLPPFLRLSRLNATRQCGRHPSRRSHGSKAGHVQEASRQRDLHGNAQDLETGQFVTVISPSQRSSLPPSRPPTFHVDHHHHHVDRSCPSSDHHHTTTASSPSIIRPSISNHLRPYPIRARVKEIPLL